MARGTPALAGHVYVDGVLHSIHGEPVVEVDEGLLVEVVEDAPTTPLPAAYLDARRAATLAGLGLTRGE